LKRAQTFKYETIYNYLCTTILCLYVYYFSQVKKKRKKKGFSSLLLPGIVGDTDGQDVFGRKLRQRQKWPLLNLFFSLPTKKLKKVSKFGVKLIKVKNKNLKCKFDNWRKNLD